MDTAQQTDNMKFMRRATRPSGWKMALAGLGGAALLTACAPLGSGSGSGSSSASASATGTVPGASSSASPGVPCRQITLLRTELAELTHMTGQTVPARQILSFVAQAQRELTTLTGQAGAFSEQANELRADLAEIGKDARAQAMHPSSSGMGALDSAVATLKNHARPLIREMQAVCPGQ